MCNSLSEIRIDEYLKLEKCSVLSTGLEHIWSMFIAGDLQVKSKLTLGNTNLYEYLNDKEKISNIFDTFCKNYLKRAWQRRHDIISSVPRTTV